MSEAVSSSTTSAQAVEPSLDSRLLAEAARAYEASLEQRVDDQAAVTQAVAAGGDFEQRIQTRAVGLSIREKLQPALRHIRGVLGAIILIAVILGLLAGAGAARGALSVDRAEPVNIFWLLGGVLGGQTILLLGWLVLAMIGPTALRGASLGGFVFAIARRLARRASSAREYLAAVNAYGSLYSRGTIGRATFGSITHGVWVAFNVGCLVTLVALLSARQYNFVWESTIVSDDAYISITRSLAAGPGLFVETPTTEQIATARFDPIRPDAPNQQTDAARTAWSGLLVGAIVCYGLLPRVLLLVVCLIVRTIGARRFRLDPEQPGYARLRSRLMPVARRLAAVDEDDSPAAPAAAPVSRDDIGQRPVGPPAIIGLEIEPPATGWPPPLRGEQLTDLGLVESREDRQRALEELTYDEHEPRALVIVCALTTTPDRGVAAFIRSVKQAISRPTRLVLTAGEALRKRTDGDGVDRRAKDWREMALATGIAAEDIVELDLDHLTDTTTRALSKLIQNGTGSQVEADEDTRAMRIDAAFDLIVECAAEWKAQPSAAQQAKLHRAIARLYESKRKQWANVFNVPRNLDEVDLKKTLQTSGERVVSILPERLKINPRWAAAGALAGAFGCIAAATVATPIAIASLPWWSGIGAAVVAAMQIGGKQTDDDTATQPPDFGDGVRSATLFAMLLQLQGNTEATITRIIDSATAEHEQSEITSTLEAERFLDELRHRFEMALAGETTR